MAGLMPTPPDLASLINGTAARAGIRIGADRVPHARNEAWRRARLRVLTDPAQFAALATQSSALAVSPPERGALFHNDRFLYAAASPTVGAAQPRAESNADDAFRLLNNALCGNAPAFVMDSDRPLHVTWRTQATQPFLANARAVVRVPAGQRAIVIEQCLPTTGFLNCALDIVLEDAAELVHYRLAAPATAALGLLRLHVVVGKQARYRGIWHAHGSQFWREETTLQLAGAGANANVDCSDVTWSNHFLERRIEVRHEAADGESRVRCHGVAAHTAQLAFNGRILIGTGGAGTNAALSTRNLLLANTAEIDAKPELEIYNDAVRCSHGATIGQLDADAVFYLQSRGIDADHARRLLLAAFVRAPVTDSVDAEPALAAALADALGDVPADTLTMAVAAAIGEASAR